MMWGVSYRMKLAQTWISSSLKYRGPNLPNSPRVSMASSFPSSRLFSSGSHALGTRYASALMSGQKFGVGSSSGWQSMPGSKSVTESSLLSSSFLSSTGIHKRYQSTDANHQSDGNQVGEGVSQSTPGVLDFGETVQEIAAEAAAEGSPFDTILDPLVQCFVGLHDVTGLPWWGTVLAVTGIVRVITAPLTIKSMKSAAEMQKLAPKIREIQTKYKSRRSPEDVQLMQSEITGVYSKSGVNPIKSLMYGLVQAPAYLAVFFTIRRVSSDPPPGYEEGGLWWFSNLAVADPLHILPAAAAGSMVAAIWLTKSTGPVSKSANVMKVVFSVFAGTIPFLTINFPAALHLYWCTSTASQMLYQVPAIKKMFGIPLPAAPGAQEGEKGKTNLVIPEKVYTTKPPKGNKKNKKRAHSDQRTFSQKLQAKAAPMTEQIQKDFTPKSEKSQASSVSHAPKNPYQFGTFKESESVADFMSCQLEEGHITTHEVKIEDLLNSYNEWCVDRGLKPGPAEDLFMAIAAKRYHPVLVKNQLTAFRGVRVMPLDKSL